MDAQRQLSRRVRIEPAGGILGGGLPIGVQLIGAAFADAMLVRIGRAFQHSTDWHLRRPQSLNRA